MVTSVRWGTFALEESLRLIKVPLRLEVIFPCLGGSKASRCFGYESASDPTSWSLLVGMAAVSCAYYFFCDRQEFYGRNNKLLCRRVIEASHLQLQALKVMAHQRQ